MRKREIPGQFPIEKRGIFIKCFNFAILYLENCMVSLTQNLTTDQLDAVL